MKHTILIFIPFLSFHQVLKGSSSSTTSTKSWSEVAKLKDSQRAEGTTAAPHKENWAQKAVRFPQAVPNKPHLSVKKGVPTTTVRKEDIWQAATRGNLAFFKTHPDCIHASTNDKNVSPLHWAACKGHTDLVTYLLDQGADVNAVDIKGNTPLSMASCDGQNEAVSILLARGANTALADMRGRTALSWAVGHPEIVQLLVNHKADVRHTDRNKKDALQWAAGQGCAESVRILLMHGASVTAKDDTGSNALHWAAIGGHVNAGRHLIGAKIQVNVQDAHGQTALSWAAHYGHTDFIALLLTHGASVTLADKKGKTPLHWASKSLAATQLLLDAGAQAEVYDHADNTPLSWATYEGSTEVADLLIKHGARATRGGKKDMSPLEFAAANGHFDTVLLLLRYESLQGSCSPLSRAAGKGYLDIVRLLLKSGIAVHNSDPETHSPRFFAADSGHLAIVKELCAHKADPNEEDGKGQTPFMQAVFKGDSLIVDALLEAGAQIKKADKEGKTVLHWSQDPLIAKKLIDRGALVDARDIRGKSPVMWASFDGNLPLVKLLVESGADTSLIDKNQLNIEALAIMSGNCELVGYICSLPQCTFSQVTGPKKRTAYHWVLRMCKGAFKKNREQMPESVAACMLVQLSKRGVNSQQVDGLGNSPLDNLTNMKLAPSKHTLLEDALTFRDLTVEEKGIFQDKLANFLDEDQGEAELQRNDRDIHLIKLARKSLGKARIVA